jgi:hypothetical protein
MDVYMCVCSSITLERLEREPQRISRNIASEMELFQSQQSTTNFMTINHNNKIYRFATMAY